ncbi:MAG TPA: hypothetical protein VL977_05570, partial [Solirubrobacteraceae bacterium]|nr:hypothetical protein [Solirubrobacteraceae bacterium]
DLISLALCLLDTRRPSDPQAPDVAVGDTLRTIEQPPGARLIERVPAGPLEHRTLRLAVKAPGVVEIDPFPFAQTGARFALPARRIEDRRLGAAEAAAAFHAAEVTRIELTLTGRG